MQQNFIITQNINYSFYLRSKVHHLIIAAQLRELNKTAYNFANQCAYKTLTKIFKLKIKLGTLIRQLILIDWYYIYEPHGI